METPLEWLLECTKDAQEAMLEGEGYHGYRDSPPRLVETEERRGKLTGRLVVTTMETALLGAFLTEVRKVGYSASKGFLSRETVYVKLKTRR